MESQVKSLYTKLLEQGYTKKDAARTAQAKTGYSLVSEKPIKQKKLNFNTKGAQYGGQYNS